MSKQKIYCPCEQDFEVDHQKELVLTPELASAILEGQFQSYICPACGRTVKTELEAQIHFDYFSLSYYPELEKSRFLMGQITVPSGVDRVCFGYKELVEKVKLRQSDLDDRVIEILKYSYLQINQYKEKVSLFFHEQKDTKLEFYLYGLKKDEIGITAVQMDFYQKIALLLNKPPEDWQQIIQPPYVSVEKISISLH